MFSAVNYALAKKEWDKAYADLKILDIGRRNLILDSSGKLGTWGAVETETERISGIDCIKVNATTTDQSTKSSNYFKVNMNTEYTIRVLKKSTGNSTGFDVFFLGRSEGCTRDFEFIHSVMTGSKGETGVVVGELTEYVNTFTTGDIEYEGYVRLDNNGTTDGNESTVWYGELKLEKGDKATPYIPAPEDINADPFVAEMAETSYRSEANEKKIKELENAITALGGNP